MSSFAQRLDRPRDAAALVAFRAMFGVVMTVSVARYFANGWIERFYVEPAHRLHYYGFDWVEPLPAPYMNAVFVVLGVAAACIGAGLFYRAATVVFWVVFTYVHLLDVSVYLNHYYLVSVLALWLCFLPLHRAGSLDALRRPRIRATALPAWMTYALRAQVGLVYVFAALAKVSDDWLIHGQPLGIWLHSRTETPLIGRWLDEHWVALVMSWAGFLYDLTIPFWLSWRRSRPIAFLVVCAFHFMTSVFFNIGIFPVIMTIGATLFFDGDWPRRLLRLPPIVTSSVARSLPRPALVAIAVWFALQIAIPLRSHLYGGNVLWHEQGMRWSWRVMVREKNGTVTYRVRVDDDPREREVSPHRYLRLHQEREFAGQPDLILQVAHRIRDDLLRRGHRRVEVRADAWVSWNGRPAARIIDPDVDLAKIEDGFGRAQWILPAPSSAPMRLRSAREAREGA